MNRNNNLMGKFKDRAVSPVVGAILLVGIVVIMSATIGIVIFNMGGEVPKIPPQASLEMTDVRDDNFSYVGEYVSGSYGGEPLREDFIHIFHNGGDPLRAEKIEISILNSSNSELAQWNGTYWKVKNADNAFFRSSANNFNNIKPDLPFDPNPFTTGSKLTIIVKESGWGDGEYTIVLVDKPSGQLVAKDTVTVQ